MPESNHDKDSDNSLTDEVPVHAETLDLEESDDTAPGEGTPFKQMLREVGARRVAVGAVAGLGLLLGPVALASAMADDGESDAVETASNEDSSPLLSVANQTAERAERSAQRELDNALASGNAQRGNKPAAETTTTTTTAPPTTTTTAPPTTTTTAPPTTEAPATTAAPEPSTDVAPVESSGSLGDPYYIPTWDHLAQCESGGDWSINTGNGFYGGIQFTISSWQAVGGTGYPHEASRETQIAMGQRLWEMQGWGAWPACTASFGWR